MDHLLALPDERRQVLFDEAGARLGLSAGSVEMNLSFVRTFSSWLERHRRLDYSNCEAVRRRGFFGAHPAAGLEPLQSVLGPVGLSRTRSSE